MREGSGYAIACAGLRAATRAIDGRGPDTSLPLLLAEAAGTDSLENLIDQIYLQDWSAPQIAALAPAVIAASRDADPEAMRILEIAAKELSRAAEVVIQDLGWESDQFEVVLSGGILQGSPALVTMMQENLLKPFPRADVHLAREEPVVGAGLLALPLI